MRLISGIVELKPGWFVRVPYSMTTMEFGRYRFGPLAAIPAMAGSALSGIGTGLFGASTASTVSGALASGTAFGAGVGGPAGAISVGAGGGGLLSSMGGMLGTAAKFGGPLMNILGQQQQGGATSADIKAQENIALYNAQVQEREAEAARQKARYDQIRHEKEAQRIRGLMSARLGAAGAAGSPVTLGIKLAQAEELELENLLIGYEGEVAAMRSESRAALDRYQAEILRGKRKASKKSSQFDMFGSILSGLGDIFG